MYGSLAISLILGVAISVFNARVLGPEIYGDFKFIQGVWRFLVAFLSGGIFVAGGRLLAQEQKKEFRQEIMGTLILICLAQGILFSTLIFLFSWPQEKIFNNFLGNDFRFIAPLIVFVSFRPFMENTLKGDNRVYSIGMFHVLPLAVYLLASLLVVKLTPFGLRSALFLTLLSLGTIVIMILWYLAPLFRNIMVHAKKVWKETKVFGFDVWIGSLFNNNTILLAPLCIAYFHDNLSVGYFSLSMTLASPLRFIPASIGVALFKRFANKDRIHPSITWATIGISVCSVVAFIIVLYLAFPIVYTENYLPALPLCYIIAIGAILQGIGGFFNNFLCAKGYGKASRNASLAQGVVNLLGYVTLVPPYAGLGAAVTLLASGMIYLCMILKSYIFLGTRNALPKKI